MDKLIFVANIKKEFLIQIGFPNAKSDISIYRSKGLLSHLLKRKHYVAAKYFDYIPEILSSPDYAGVTEGNIEMVKCFKNNIFLSVKLDVAKSIYYVATLFDVKESKIEAYCKSGRLQKIDVD